MPEPPKIIDGAVDALRYGPISNLFDDILRSIFCLNIDTPFMVKTECDELPAFYTLVNNSHVCSNWRQIIISSPGLWARVVDLSFLQSREWREEVMRRTGSALLSVTAHTKKLRYGAQYHFYEAEEIIVSILEDNWSRIRYMDVHFDSPDGWMLVEARVWWLLGRPSPALETFIFRTPGQKKSLMGLQAWVSIVPPKGHKLFDNQAPDLFDFCSLATTDLKAPWLRHIRYLSLCGPLPVDELLRALSAMPLLESLRDERNSIIPASGRLSPDHGVSPPALREVVVYSKETNLRAYQDFIEHISIPSSTKSRLKISIQPPAVSEVISNWTSVEGAEFKNSIKLAVSFSAFCNLSSASAIHISIYFTQFTLMTALPSGGQATFTLDTSKIDLGRRSAGTFCGTFCARLFTDLKSTIVFNDLWGVSLSISRGTQHDLDFGLAVMHLMGWLSSARILETSGSTFQVLMGPEHLFTSHIASTMFPDLHALGLTSCPEPTEMQCIKTFLSSRVALGNPIEQLSIHMISNHADDTRRTADLRWLNGFPGMKVFLLYGGEVRVMKNLGKGGKDEKISKCPIYPKNQ